MNTDYPDFLIVGAPKCGTSSLYFTLLNHDKIVGSKIKELQYFTRYYHNHDINWYLSLFPKKTPHQLLCEATVDYNTPLIINRIKNTFEGRNLKLIFVVRNPTYRFISQYIHFRAKNFVVTHDDVFEIVKQSPTYYPQNWNVDFFKTQTKLFKELVEDTNDSYYKNGEYIDTIKLIEELFGRNNLHLIVFEDLIKNPTEELSKVFNFLNVEDYYIPFGKFNTAEDWKRHYDASKEIDANSVNILREYYKPLNKRLYEYINRDLNWDSYE